MPILPPAVTKQLVHQLTLADVYVKAAVLGIFLLLPKRGQQMHERVKPS